MLGLDSYSPLGTLKLHRLSCWARPGSRSSRPVWPSGSRVILFHPHAESWVQENRMWDHLLWNLKVHPREVLTLSIRAPSPQGSLSSQRAALTGDQVVKSKHLWGAFSFKLTQKRWGGTTQSCDSCLKVFRGLLFWRISCLYCHIT